MLPLPLGGWSQTPTAREGKPVRVAVAKRTAEKIQVDGVLDEPAWQAAEPTGGFIQQDPKEGEPASEVTEVRVLYDQDNLYVAVLCYDRNPEGIIINDISASIRKVSSESGSSLMLSRPGVPIRSGSPPAGRKKGLSILPST